MGYLKTGIIVPSYHLAHVRALAQVAAQIPRRKVRGVWLNESAERRLHEAIDSLAVQAGLPPPDKDEHGNVIHYGMLVSGEITHWDEEGHCSLNHAAVAPPRTAAPAGLPPPAAAPPDPGPSSRVPGDAAGFPIPNPTDEET